MNDKSTFKPYADLCSVVGKYTKDGRERNRYHKVGTLFASPHKNNFRVKLDSAPLGDGWLSAFVREEWFDASDEPAKPTDVTVSDADMDKPINLDDIPF